MPLQSDPVLGVSYIDPDYFLANARVFGCEPVVAGLISGDVLPLLAAASRMVEAETNRDFLSGPITENHRFDLKTGRVVVNRPPLITLTSYRIRTGAGLVSAFSVTPVQTDGQNNVSFGAIYYNRQENYLELSSLAMAEGLTAPLVTLGLNEAQVEITYTSFADVPKQVVAATGYMAACILNESSANSMIAPGLESVRADDVEVRRGKVSQAISSAGSAAVPTLVKTLLRGLRPIAVG